jgi:hypothetical protein
MKKLYQLVRVTSQWRHNAISGRNDGRDALGHAQLITHSARVVCCYRVPFLFNAVISKRPTPPPSSEKLYLSSQPVQADSDSWALDVAYKFLEHYTRYLKLLGGTTLPAARLADNDKVRCIGRVCVRLCVGLTYFCCALVQQRTKGGRRTCTNRWVTKA